MRNCFNWIPAFAGMTAGGTHRNDDGGTRRNDGVYFRRHSGLVLVSSLIACRRSLPQHVVSRGRLIIALDSGIRRNDDGGIRRNDDGGNPPE